MAGMSRWLVGSSSTSRLVPVAINIARTARVRSPGERSAAARPARGPLSPNLASRVRASTGSMPLWATSRSTTVSSLARAPRAWSSSPTTTRLPSVAVPLSGWRWPSSRPRRVDLPDPLGPTMETRSPCARSRVTGPKVKLPRTRVASRSWATTSPDRGALGSSRRSSHSLRGSATPSLARLRSSWLSRLSRARTFLAPLVAASMRAPRAARSGSGGFFFARSAPRTDCSLAPWTWATRWLRCSSDAS